MIREMENLLEGNQKKWKVLESSLDNGTTPLEPAIHLIKAQLKRARNPMLTGGFSPCELSNNNELVYRTEKNVRFDPEAKPEDQIAGVRNYYSMLRNHFRLQMLGNQFTDETKQRLDIVEKFLATFPPEPKVYPSEQNKPSEQSAGFFQEKS